MPSLLSLLLTGLVPLSLAQEPAIDADAPAVEEPRESIWTFIEAADGSPPSAEVVEATQELVEERAAELANVGSVGASRRSSS
ncbi:MAG: hypothetical protein ACK4YP_23650, partial [Myxococcota bacterium]